MRSFPKVMYTEEGKLMTERVWKETLEAFHCDAENLSGCVDKSDLSAV